MSSKSIFITGLIVFLLTGSAFVYRLWREPAPSVPSPAPTAQPTATPDYVSPFSCAPHCSEEQIHVAWDRVRELCTKMNDVPHNTLVLRFSQALNGKKVQIPVEREEVYKCGSDIYVF